MGQSSSKKTELSTILKLIIIMFVAFYLWQTYRMFKSIEQWITFLNQTLPDQKKSTEEVHNAAKKQINEVTNAMVSGSQALNEKTSGLEKKISHFKDDMLSDLEKFNRNRNERIYTETTYKFLNDQYYTYDREIYEKRAKKVEREANIVLPTFDSYLRLKERMLYCAIKSHNETAENYYKNRIAQLKLEGRQKEIASVRKPTILPWPISEKALKKYNDNCFTTGEIRVDTFLSAESLIELDGRCKG